MTHAETTVRAQINKKPECCRNCVELDMDYLGLAAGFQAICLKGHSMTELTCVDQRQGRG